MDLHSCYFHTWKKSLWNVGLESEFRFFILTWDRQWINMREKPPTDWSLWRRTKSISSASCQHTTKSYAFEHNTSVAKSIYVWFIIKKQPNYMLTCLECSVTFKGFVTESTLSQLSFCKTFTNHTSMKISFQLLVVMVWILNLTTD